MNKTAIYVKGKPVVIFDWRTGLVYTRQGIVSIDYKGGKLSNEYQN